MVKNKVTKMKTHKGLSKRFIRRGDKVIHKPAFQNKYAIKRGGRNRRRRPTRVKDDVSFLKNYKSSMYLGYVKS